MFTKSIISKHREGNALLALRLALFRLVDADHFGSKVLVDLLFEEADLERDNLVMGAPWLGLLWVKPAADELDGATCRELLGANAGNRAQDNNLARARFFRCILASIEQDMKVAHRALVLRVTKLGIAYQSPPDPDLFFHRSLTLTYAFISLKHRLDAPII